MEFFDKMKSKVGPAFSDASQKLKVAVDQVTAAAQEKLTETRLKNELRELHSQKNEMLQALGSKVLELHRGDGIGSDDLTEELAQLEVQDLKIADKQCEITERPLRSQ